MNTERKPGYYRIITVAFPDYVIVKWDGCDFYHLEVLPNPILKGNIISIIETPISPSPPQVTDEDGPSEPEIVVTGYSFEEVIEWTEWLGEMGWYKERGKPEWHHDDEVGGFANTEDLVRHYLAPNKY